MATPARARDRRLEVRTTSEERAPIDRAVEVAGTDLTSFVVSNLTDAARRVLADRDRFSLPPEAAAEWERINLRPAEELAGLRRLMQLLACAPIRRRYLRSPYPFRRRTVRAFGIAC